MLGDSQSDACVRHVLCDMSNRSLPKFGLLARSVQVARKGVATAYYYAQQYAQL
jgi:hypothetical protein